MKACQQATFQETNIRWPCRNRSFGIYSRRIWWSRLRSNILRFNNKIEGDSGIRSTASAIFSRYVSYLQIW